MAEDTRIPRALVKLEEAEAILRETPPAPEPPPVIPTEPEIPVTPEPPLSPPIVPKSDWLLAVDVDSLAMSGASWDKVRSEGAKVSSGMNLNDAVGVMTDQTTLCLYARGLKARRQGLASDRQVVMDILNNFPKASLAAPQGSLGPSRNVAAIALTASVIGHKPTALLDWLKMVVRKDFSGRTIISTHRDRPNNWGTHAGASRIAVARLVGDKADLDQAVAVFKGFLGDRAAWASFKFGDPAWQVTPSRPINPKGAMKTIEGTANCNVDGVLVDDQRRQGDPGHATEGHYATWPPARENYPWEGFQGLILQAELLYPLYPDVYEWQDRAILRAATWLYSIAKNPAVSDDTFIPHVLNLRYKTNFTAPVPAGIGKGWGFTDWTH